jgi:hypothetical protein
MKANAHLMNGRNVAVNLLVFLQLALVLLVLNNTRLPLISDDRGALMALVLLGFLMHVLGVNAARGSFFPFRVVVGALGVVILFLVAAVLLGWELPFLITARQVFLALAVILFAQWMLTGVDRFLQFDFRKA